MDAEQMKQWIVDGDYYHKKKSAFKRLLGEYGFAYDWKDRPRYVWRKDNKRFIEGIFDREEKSDGTVERFAAKLIYTGPDNPELFDLINAWAEGHEVKWRLQEDTVDYLQVFKENWRAAFQSAIRIRKAPRGWIISMAEDFEKKRKKLLKDIESEEEIQITSYLYNGW